MTAQPPDNQDRKVFQLIKELIKNLRLFQSEAVFCENITFTQFCILDYVVTAKGRLGLSSLHPLLGVEKSTTTRLTAPLLQRKLLTRQKSSRDSRAVELVITPEGRHIHQNVWSCITGFIGGCRGHIPTAKRQQVLQAVGLFVESLSNCCRPETEHRQS